MIADGRADVTVDGEYRTSLGPGDSFGEIALLRETLRTATITATAPLGLFVLERRHFVPMVTGYRASAAEADAKVVALMPELDR